MKLPSLITSCTVLMLSQGAGVALAEDDAALVVHGIAGIGYSFETNVDNLVLLQPREGSAAAELLDAGGVSYTENLLSLGLVGRWQLSDQVSVSTLLPFGFVQGPSSSTLPGLVSTGFAFGDVLLEVNYEPFAAAARDFDVVLGAGFDFGTSQALSLGDGFMAALAGIEVSRGMSPRTRVRGSVLYEHPLKENGTQLGDTLRAGLGVAVLTGDGEHTYNVDLTYATTADAQLASGRTLDFGQGVGVSFGLHEAGAGWGGDLHIANIDEFEFSALTMGFTLRYRLFGI